MVAQHFGPLTGRCLGFASHKGRGTFSRSRAAVVVLVLCRIAPAGTAMRRLCRRCCRTMMSEQAGRGRPKCRSNRTARSSANAVTRRSKSRTGTLPRSHSRRERPTRHPPPQAQRRGDSPVRSHNAPLAPKNRKLGRLALGPLIQLGRHLLPLRHQWLPRPVQRRHQRGRADCSALSWSVATRTRPLSSRIISTPFARRKYLRSRRFMRPGYDRSAEPPTSN